MMLYRQFATQEEIDKEYDVEKSAPDFQRYAEFNINESKKARDELECLLDVPFGPTVEENSTSFRLKIPTRLFSFLSTAGTGVRTAVKNSAGLRGDRSRSASRW